MESDKNSRNVFGRIRKRFKNSKKFKNQQKPRKNTFGQISLKMIFVILDQFSKYFSHKLGQHFKTSVLASHSVNK